MLSMKLLLGITLLLSQTYALSWRSACQALTSDPLSGCPPNTVLAAPIPHPYNANGNYPTIQTVINTLPNDNTLRVVLIPPGTYTEQLNITRPGPTYLLGQTDSPQNQSRNAVRVRWANATGTPSTGTYDNAFTTVLTVAPNLNASLTGSGPTGFNVPENTPWGSTDFRVYNIDFSNEYLPYSAGPSLTLSTGRSNVGAYYSGFYSYQDTVCIHSLCLLKNS